MILNRPKADQHPYRVHIADRDIADEERDERPEIPKGSGKLSQIVVIPAQPHGALLPAVRQPHGPWGMYYVFEGINSNTKMTAVGKSTRQTPAGPGYPPAPKMPHTV